MGRAMLCRIHSVAGHVGCPARRRSHGLIRRWRGDRRGRGFVDCVGDWGGYMMLDCGEPLAVHKFCSMLPAFVFEAPPVVPVMDAVRVELETIAFRDELKTRQPTTGSPSQGEPATPPS